MAPSLIREDALWARQGPLDFPGPHGPGPVRPLLPTRCLDYLLITSPNNARHQLHLIEVIRRLRENGITINPERSIFAQPVVKHLGNRVSSSDITPLTLAETRFSALDRRLLAYHHPRHLPYAGG